LERRVPWGKNWGKKVGNFALENNKPKGLKNRLQKNLNLAKGIYLGKRNNIPYEKLIETGKLALRLKMVNINNSKISL